MASGRRRLIRPGQFSLVRVLTVRENAATSTSLRAIRDLSCSRQLGIKMQNSPYRTNSTWLSDDDLIILDVLFNGGAGFRLLRRENFQAQWNLRYCHHLEDAELQHRLQWLCEQAVLETCDHNNQIYFQMTAIGGELWSQERCPIWDRFCTGRHTTISENRTMISLIAVSTEVRDDFLRLWPMAAVRTRTASIKDNGIISLLRFQQLHVGVLVYDEWQKTWTSKSLYTEHLERYLDHLSRLEQQRSWWRNVPELQKFVRVSDDD